MEPSALVATILEHFEPWRGYGGGMLGLVGEWRRGVPPEEAATAIFPEGSFGNGAAMRVAPVAALWWHEPDTLADVARRQAEVTHAHPLGVDGAVLQARAVGRAAATAAFGGADLRALADTASSATLRDGIERATALAAAWPGDPDLTLAEVAAQLGNDVTAPRSVPAALWAAAVADTAAEVVELALGVGGDADTIAAMAGAVAGAAVGGAGLPGDWIARLEDGPRGRRYAVELAERLAARP